VRTITSRTPFAFLATAVVFLLLANNNASAQVVDNPRIVEFFPSADHNVTLPSGQPAVERYDFEIYLVGATAPFQTQPLGKPAPDGTGVIRYDFSSQVVGWPLPGGTYESRVAAVGPNGTGKSSVSNQFTFSAYTCTYTVSPATLSFVQAGATQNLAVTSSLSTCTWNVAGLPTWLTATPMSGTANGTVAVTATANPTTSARNATFTVAGKSITADQAGLPTCNPTVSPTTLSSPAAGGNLSVTVNDATGCAWSVTGLPAWITASPMSGTGNGTNQTVTLAVEQNTTINTRNASFAIAGRGVTVNQAAAPCTFSLSPITANVEAGGGVVTTSLTTTFGCDWTATSNQTWATVTPTIGNASVTLSVVVSPNASTSPRTANITIGGQLFQVSQAGAAPCTQAVTPSVGYIDAAGGNVTFTVQTGASCTWAVAIDKTWATLDKTIGTGNGTVTVTATPNVGSARTATLTIGDATVLVSQAGAPAAPTEVKVYALVNANTGETIAAITNGSIIRLNQLPTQKVNLRATTEPQLVGSVAMVYDSIRYIDNTYPYELMSGSDWKLKQGMHTILGTPYEGPDATGVGGTALSVRFQVKSK
jgi:hypothetical protein